MLRRSGLTLLEVLVVVTVIAILVGLLLPAVQRVRAAAIRTKSVNNVKQIMLAIHNFSSGHGEKLPVLTGDLTGPNPRESLHVALLDYIEQGAWYRRYALDAPPPTGQLGFVGPYVSPADPTVTGTVENQFGVTSYAANAFVFQLGTTFTASIPDGTSNTIGFAEHYAHCRTTAYFYFVTLNLDGGHHRASFADGKPLRENYSDVTPRTRGTPPVSGPDHDTYPIIPTFQAAPAIDKCHPAVPQTPHASGMITGLMDGSVRITAPGISTATFWGAVTPAGGEVLSDW